MAPSSAAAVAGGAAAIALDLHTYESNTLASASAARKPVRVETLVPNGSRPAEPGVASADFGFTRVE